MQFFFCAFGRQLNFKVGSLLTLFSNPLPPPFLTRPLKNDFYRHFGVSEKNLWNIETQILLEIITSRDARSTCFKGSQTSCTEIISCVFLPKLRRKRSHHVMDACCWIVHLILNQQCANWMRCKRRGSKKSHFGCFSGGFWFSQMSLFSMNSSTRPPQTNKITQFFYTKMPLVNPLY